MSLRSAGPRTSDRLANEMVTSRAYANIVGLLWLVLAFALLLLAIVLAALASTALVAAAGMGIVALAQSALLIVRDPHRRLFLLSTVIASVFTGVGVTGYLRVQGTIPASLPVMVFVALSTLVVLVSVAGARSRA